MKEERSMSWKDKTEKFWDRLEDCGARMSTAKLCEVAQEELGAELEDIIDEWLEEQHKPICRIRYQSFEEGPESYIFELRKDEDDDWSFMCSYELKNDMVHFTALTQIRELMRKGYGICFR